MTVFTITYRPKRGFGPIVLGPFTTHRRYEHALKKHRRETRSASNRYVIHEGRVNHMDTVP